ncbi:hypothetical protein Rhal01_03084 [Rubritalea halochordaticola]|uniref:Carrier domain-containing protein n=1 Tax=Rubritalea halochordaticola TaxID=714537 RepID=A0ABP9V747_9BACT
MKKGVCAILVLAAIFLIIGGFLYKIEAGSLSQIAKPLGGIYLAIVIAVSARLYKYYLTNSLIRDPEMDAKAVAELQNVSDDEQENCLYELVCGEFGLSRGLVGKSLGDELKVPLPEIESVVDTLERRFKLPIEVDEVDSSTSIAEIVELIQTRRQTPTSI